MTQVCGDERCRLPLQVNIFLKLCGWVFGSRFFQTPISPNLLAILSTWPVNKNQHPSMIFAVNTREPTGIPGLINPLHQHQHHPFQHQSNNQHQFPNHQHSHYPRLSKHPQAKNQSRYPRIKTYQHKKVTKFLRRKRQGRTNVILLIMELETRIHQTTYAFTSNT
jgi:hypothetical protein